LALSSPLLPGQTKPLEQAVEVGKTLSSVEITRILPDWGVICKTDDGLQGFAHVSSYTQSQGTKLTLKISHLSDERLLALTNHTKQFQVGTLHRARVIGHSPMDGVVLLSFEQKVLDQVFMQVDELKVGQVLKVSTTIPKARKD
jgi:rRNA biogenesis protein RRP5